MHQESPAWKLETKHREVCSEIPPCTFKEREDPIGKVIQVGLIFPTITLSAHFLTALNHLGKTILP